MWPLMWYIHTYVRTYLRRRDSWHIIATCFNSWKTDKTSRAKNRFKSTTWATLEDCIIQMCKPHIATYPVHWVVPFTLSVCKQGGNCTVYVAGESVHGASKFGSVFCIGAMTSSVYPGDGVSVTVSACLCFPSTPHVSKEYTRKHSNVPTTRVASECNVQACRVATYVCTYISVK